MEEYFYNRYHVTPLGTIDVLARGFMVTYRARFVMRIKYPDQLQYDLDLHDLLQSEIRDLIDTPDGTRLRKINDYDDFMLEHHGIELRD